MNDRERKTASLTVRLTPSERAALHGEAIRNGVFLSRWIRMKLGLETLPFEVEHTERLDDLHRRLEHVETLAERVEVLEEMAGVDRPYEGS